MMYGAQAWENAIFERQKTESFLLQAQRCKALRVARCYPIVSDIAALLLARMPLASLLAIDRKTIAEQKRSGETHSKAILRRDVIRQWQSMWDTTTKASWTKRLILDVARWWYLGPRSVSFHMSQVLMEHGCFQKCLHSKARAQSLACVHYTLPVDDTEHTVFLCPFWDQAKLDLSRSIDRSPRA